MPVYEGNRTRRISFPIGGIGTGSIGLAGNGRLIDWEIFNRPGKGLANGFSHILVKAERDGRVEDVRVLQGDYPGSGIGGETVGIFRGNGGFGYGFGPYRGTMAGVPHFRRSSFLGEFPVAELRFTDRAFPGSVKLRAFNPFIPLNDKDSSLPIGIFEVEITNGRQAERDFSVMFSLNNPLPYATTRNTFFKSGAVRGIELKSSLDLTDDLHDGNMCIATDAEDVCFQRYWYRADWFDSLQTFWQDVCRPGGLADRDYGGDNRSPSGSIDFDGEDMCTLEARFRLAPGEKKRARFVLGWYFPNCANYWDPLPGTPLKRQWRNYYATVFGSARECVEYAFKNMERLRGETERFRSALFRMTMPEACIDAVSANLSILKSPTVLRLEDGSFYGFEGCNADSGCCEGSCSHVWNYAYALPYLFPKLERSMRDLEYRYSQRRDGSVAFRLRLPLGRGGNAFRACVDGQMGGVIKVYRDFKLCGDLEWLRGKWDAVRKSVEFAWAETNEDKWDYDRDGVMEGRQHHTLDMELFGPSSWLNGFYLAALMAASEIAALLGHHAKAKEYALLAEKGRIWSDKHLFNGEYYQQATDLKDSDLLRRYDAGSKPLVGNNAMDAYWNSEAGEIKYQIANGSSVDQVIAQWHANLCGLGNVFDHKQVVSALKSIYRYNYKKSFREEFNPARLYCYDDEGGVKVCAWPPDAARPAIPITYGNEVMCGMEYQTASHMVQEGLAEKGFEIVRSVRARFDGDKRNPWNEFECGSNYARSMASFALVPAVSGYVCDLYRKRLRFAPVRKDRPVRTLWSNADGWGEYCFAKGMHQIEVLYGGQEIRSLELGGEIGTATARLNGRRVRTETDKGVVYFCEPLVMKAGDALKVNFGGAERPAGGRGGKNGRDLQR